MLLAAFVIFLSKSISSVCFAYVAENITLGVRKDLYAVILRKHIGWHDEGKNGSGVMSSTLSTDCQTLNGVSSEGTSVMIESIAALLWGVGLAFYFSWPMALSGLAITPFLIVAAAASAKADNKQFFNIDDDEDEKNKAADLLVGDTIQNYKVVSSFGNDQLIIEKFQEMLRVKLSTEISEGYCFGFKWGLSQAIQNMAFGLLYWASAQFQYYYRDSESDVFAGDNMYISMFCLLFGAFTAGQASQFGPDIAKA